MVGEYTDEAFSGFDRSRAAGERPRGAACTRCVPVVCSGRVAVFRYGPQIGWFQSEPASDSNG